MFISTLYRALDSIFAKGKVKVAFVICMKTICCNLLKSTKKKNKFEITPVISYEIINVISFRQIILYKGWYEKIIFTFKIIILSSIKVNNHNLYKHNYFKNQQGHQWN